MNTTSARRQRGITLVEGSIVTAIVAILVSVATPNLGKMVERRHIEGAAAQLETDIQFARSLAVARNQPVRVSFESASSASCYVIHTGGANDCECGADGNAVCRGTAEALRTVRFPAGGPVGVRSNSRSILADNARGTITPTATMQVQGTSGTTMNVIVNIMGRVRNCAATSGLPGYTRC